MVLRNTRWTRALFQKIQHMLEDPAIVKEVLKALLCSYCRHLRNMHNPSTGIRLQYCRADLMMILHILQSSG